jgi:O-antigen/teichoic acid export membrane protein
MKTVALVVIFLVIVIIILGILAIHTYPEKIAKKKNHPQVKAIFVTSVFGLIFFPLWMFALVWAYSNASIGNLYNSGDSEKELSDQNEHVDITTKPDAKDLKSAK